MSDSHSWCRDTARDEAVRAAEDAAAVPSIQHRDLPEQVSLLWASVSDILGRVVRLEGEMDAGEAEADTVSDESVAHGVTLRTLAETRESLAAANRGIARLAAERDAARAEAEHDVREVLALARQERDAARAECERLQARVAEFWRESMRLRDRVAELEAAPSAGGEAKQENGGMTYEQLDTANGHLSDMVKNLTDERNAARAECERLRARVAELEAAAANCSEGTNSSTEQMAYLMLGPFERRVFLTRDEAYAYQRSITEIEKASMIFVPLYAAPPEPRGWLTAEERSLLESLRATFQENADVLRSDGSVGHAENWERRVRILDAILARSTPPRVKVPMVGSTFHWIAAIRDAGGEVEGG